MSDSQPYDIRVSVEMQYIEQESDASQDRYVFAYTITIVNQGTRSAQLISRHWLITDSNGNTQEVYGEGVVGEQPNLSPGEGFRYTSGAILETPIGSMQGSYTMRADDGVEFKAPIEAFSLSDPKLLH